MMVQRRSWGDAMLPVISAWIGGGPTATVALAWLHGAKEPKVDEWSYDLDAILTFDVGGAPRPFTARFDFGLLHHRDQVPEGSS